MRAKPAPRPGAATDLADKVVAAFNTWAFKREQPSDLAAMKQVVAEALARQAPVEFVLYWGKGGRCRCGEPERQTLDYVGRLIERIRAVHAPGASVTLILTDTHAQLNGHSPACIDQYFASVEDEVRPHGFLTCRLSRLVERVAGDGAPFDDLCPDTMRKLHASAAKWYRGEGSAEDGARKYYRMNMLEKRAVEHAFPQSIFITFNGSEFRRLFPERLPIFYMYSLRRGVGVKPWFVKAEVEPCGVHDCMSHDVADVELEGW
jgi:L-tyrosine isonitrile synthase